MVKKNERIVFLDYLRIMACFMVMVVHAVEPFYFDGGMNLHIATKSDAVWVALIDSAARACVPLFAMVSCYLLFPLKVPAGVFFRRRTARILVPFFIWSCVYVWRFGGSLKELMFNFPSAAGHLWFVPMLFGIYLAMPLLSPWAEKVGRRELGGWIALWSVTAAFPYLRRLALALRLRPQPVPRYRSRFGRARYQGRVSDARLHRGSLSPPSPCTRVAPSDSSIVPAACPYRRVTGQE
jgi:surface polysaccharide O-acyltransferase-like enzyme